MIIEKELVMNKLTIIVDDKAVYIDGYAYLNLDLSFVDDGVHALHWNVDNGWIERIGFADELITKLPDWAEKCISEWNKKHIEAIEIKAKEDAEIEANKPPEWMVNRLNEYPSIEELVVASWEMLANNDTSTFDSLELKRQEVKIKYPKS